MIFIILSTTAIKSAAIQAGVTAAADANTYVIAPVGTKFQEHHLRSRKSRAAVMAGASDIPVRA